MTASEIAAFYEGPLGKAVQAVLAKQVAALLPARAQLRVLGLGYVSPYLGTFEHSLNFMLARSGVMTWPADSANRAALVDELNLPLADNCIDAALVVHGLEFCENAEDMLHEVWRVLAPQGTLVLIVPHRRGLWARSEASPFGRGQPFSRAQLSGLMRATQFELMGLQPALMAPPWFGAGVVAPFEHGARIGFGGGVLVVRATKMVHGLLPQRVKVNAFPRLRPALAGMRQASQG